MCKATNCNSKNYNLSCMYTPKVILCYLLVVVIAFTLNKTPIYALVIVLQLTEPKRYV